jgi:hypothetical protein
VVAAPRFSTPATGSLFAWRFSRAAHDRAHLGFAYLQGRHMVASARHGRSRTGNQIGGAADDAVERQDGGGLAVLGLATASRSLV